MVWSWDLSATLGWADGSTPGSWIKRREAAGLPADAGGGIDLAASDGDAEDFARPLGSIHSQSFIFTHQQTEISMCDPGMLITWQPVLYGQQQKSENVRLHIIQMIRR